VDTVPATVATGLSDADADALTTELARRVSVDVDPMNVL